MEVSLDGAWQMTEVRPTRATLLSTPTQGVREVVVDSAGVSHWDSSLPLFVVELQRWAQSLGATLDLSALPASVRTLVAELQRPPTTLTAAQAEAACDPFTAVGLATTKLFHGKRESATFLGECVLSAVRLVRQPRRFQWRSFLEEVQLCGVMALPIVSLISLLVGLIMAYQAAVQLRQFGADIYVADLVGLAVVREMGPMMAAIILAGRTGAAFAATIANMKAGEEIDALETFAINPVDFLVMPRLLAMAVMMPLLALYANLLGVVGGMLVARKVLEIPPTAYWVEMQTIVDLSDITTGLVKAFAFGLLIGISGCLRGLQAQRSAAGVGRAATSAVVTAILLIITADAIFAVIFNYLGV